MSATPDGIIVGVDVGGTKVLAGVVDAGGRVTETARRATPGRRVAPRQVEDALVEAVLEAAGGRRLAGVGVAVAGLVDTAGERVAFAPHLPWRGEALRETLGSRLGCAVILDNDANCAALAEWTYGAARNTRSTLMITVGTGIGGAFLVDGRVFRGANGMAGEFGHMQVVPDGRPCECGGRGCWEQYSSGNALVRTALTLMTERSSILEDLCAGHPERVTGPMVTTAADRGDDVALQSFVVVGEWLGKGVANLVAALDPEVVVIGGGVATVGERLLEPARGALNRELVGSDYREMPGLLAAGVGAEAGVVGAALLARQLSR